MSLFTPNSKRKSSSAKIREFVIFTMLGTLMFCSKIIMEVLPNIHIVGVLTMAYTVSLRRKALLPIYLFVILTGLYGAFSLWWLPYLYIWTVLWGVTMLLLKNMCSSRTFLRDTVCTGAGDCYGLYF